MSPLPRVVVAQLGAREHYRIPRLCERHGVLVHMHTDFWRPAQVAEAAARMPIRAVRRFGARTAPDLPDTKVTAHAIPATYWRIRQAHARDRAAKYDLHRRWGADFAKRVARALQHTDLTTFFGFSSASLEALEEARRSGALAVLDEIAPTHMEDRIIADEQARFPGWEPRHAPTPEVFLARLKAEWETADRILVNSAWTRDALVAEGANESRIKVVPIIYERGVVTDPLPVRATDEPLRVLWLGTLNLRKGFPYAVEAARRLRGKPVAFTFAGPTAIDLARVEWPDNSRYIGQVPRSDVPNLWVQHDLFLLPTLSDGFAITQIEAQAHGLPIIVTPNCGDVVLDGQSGIRVPPRDPGAIVDAITRFLDGDIDLTAASLAAIERAKAFTPDAVWPQLSAVLTPPPATGARSE